MVHLSLRLACYICLITVAVAFTLNKRDVSPPPLLTVQIPLTIDSNQRYVANVNMSSGTVSQPFKFVLAANTGYSVVAGVACDSCDNVPAYNASLSTSSKPFPGSKNVTFATGSASGLLVKDDCGLQEVDGVAWQYPNQTIVVANQSSNLFSSGTSGIFGLGTNSDGSDFDDTIFGGWMIRNPLQNSFMYGMALNPPDSDSEDGGLLHWVAPDLSAFEGDISWKNVVAPTSSSSSAVAGDSTPQIDWVVELDSWSLGAGSSSVQNSSSTLATIEPWYPNIYFPLSQAELLYNVIPGAALQPGPVNDSTVWSIPCDSQFSLALQFGQTFVLDQSNLIIQNGSSCVGAIQGWPDNSTTSFLFGGRFISSLYLIYNITRPGNHSPNSIGFANRPASKTPPPIGAIVGGTVGGVALIAAIIGGFFALKYFRRMSLRPAGTSLQHEDSRADTKIERDKAQYANILPHHDSHGMYSPPLSATSRHPLLSEPLSPLYQYEDLSDTDAATAGSPLPSPTTSYLQRGSTFVVEPFVLPVPQASASSQASKGRHVQQWVQRSSGTSEITSSGPESVYTAPGPSYAVDPYVLPAAEADYLPTGAKSSRARQSRQESAPPAYEWPHTSPSMVNASDGHPATPTLVDFSSNTESHNVLPTDGKSQPRSKS